VTWSQGGPNGRRIVGDNHPYGAAAARPSLKIKRHAMTAA